MVILGGGNSRTHRKLGNSLMYVGRHRCCENRCVGSYIERVSTGTVSILHRITFRLIIRGLAQASCCDYRCYGSYA